nr:MFS transporter [Streptomyces coryli]
MPVSRRDSATAPALTRLRIALTAFFALDGFIFAGWVVRIPDIKAQTGASHGALGLALLAVSAGAVATMMLTGRLCNRFGTRPVTVAAGVLLSLSVALPPLTHSALALGLVLLVFGAGYGGINVAMNSAAVELIAVLRRQVMPSFHAAFSLGGMVGAGIGALIAGSLSATWHLSLLTVAGLAITAAAAPTLLRGAPQLDSAATETEESAPAPRLTGRIRLLIILLGLVVLCSSYGEGSMADWSALHFKESLHAGPGLAAASYSVFALAMTIGRLCGTAVVERLGPTRTLAGGGAAAAAGMLVGSLAPNPWLAIAGFALTGLGLANIFPVTIARAGTLAGPSGIAMASTFGYGGMLLGPTVIGFLAEWTSLRVALTTIALLAAVSATVAYTTRNAVRT